MIHDSVLLIAFVFWQWSVTEKSSLFPETEEPEEKQVKDEDKKSRRRKGEEEWEEEERAGKSGGEEGTHLEML